MPGDVWQKFANLRTLLAYQYTRPGKKLLFMGTEIAPWSEWDQEHSLDWHLADDPPRVGLQRFLEALGRMYLETPCLWRDDHDPAGYAWIDCNDRDNSVISYWRRSGDSNLIVVVNLTPVPRDRYRIGVPFADRYELRLCSDDPQFGGGGYFRTRTLDAQPGGMHGHAQSILLDLPALSALVFEPHP
jgi:1,4-alpha-glucan branching enzyme